MESRRGIECKYKSLQSLAYANFVHRLAVRSGILLPLSKVVLRDGIFVKEFGNFSKDEVKHVGRLRSAIKFSDNGFFMFRNVIRWTLFSHCIGLKDPFKKIYWHAEMADFMFFEMSQPFCWKKKHLRHLDNCPENIILQEKSALELKLYNTKSLSTFNQFGFSENIVPFIERLHDLDVASL